MPAAGRRRPGGRGRRGRRTGKAQGPQRRPTTTFDAGRGDATDGAYRSPRRTREEERGAAGIVALAFVLALVPAAGAGAAVDIGPGDILVVDNGANAVFQVEPTNGAQTPVSSGGSFVSPFRIALDADGDILVADNGAFGGRGGVIRVDPTGGEQTPVSSGDSFAGPFGIAVVPTPPNTAPTVKMAAGGACGTNDRSGTITLTVGDTETAAGELTLTGTSSDTNLVPDANISFGGSGQNPTMQVSAVANKSGTARITITVSDEGSLSDMLIVTVKVGTAKSETLSGTTEADMLFGLAKNDTLNGLEGNDLLCGGDANDLLNGGDDDDTLYGQRNNDNLTGGTGADFFSGGLGNDLATDFNEGQGDTKDNTIP